MVEITTSDLDTASVLMGYKSFDDATAYQQSTPDKRLIAIAKLVSGQRSAHHTIDALLKAMTLGWSVERTSLYDEEAVEGWKWIGPNNEEISVVDSWEDLPEIPDEILALGDS